MLILTILLITTITKSQEMSNEGVFFNLIKNYRNNGSKIREKITLNWIPNIDNKMLNNTIILENGEDDLKNLILFLDNKEKISFDELEMNLNLNDLAKKHSVNMAELRELDTILENNDFDSRIKNFGKYKGQIVEIVFKFSKKIEKLSNVLINLLLEKGISKKRNRDVLNEKRFHSIGIGFAKDNYFVYTTIIMAENYICTNNCVA